VSYQPETMLEALAGFEKKVRGFNRGHCDDVDPHLIQYNLKLHCSVESEPLGTGALAGICRAH
jgi:hypothetical protein